jgi:2-desacetyl-2-hydroxyethyl bacteriochlorophyllide A dehydrogenase
MAVVFTHPNQVEWMEVDSAEPTEEDVVLEIHHSWISNGTEGSFLRGERLSGDEARREGDPLPFPMIAGYQKVGRVLSVGAKVQGFQLGDLVFASMSRVQGMFDNRFAGHVSPSVCHYSAVMPIPEHVDPLAVSGLVLTQVGYNCGQRPQILPGQTAVIIGDGLVGQWAAQTLKQRGAEVFMIGRHPDRLAKVEAFATPIVEDQAFGTIAFDRLTTSKVQVVVETVGSTQAMYAWLPRMLRNGHIVVAGFYTPSGAIDVQKALQDFRNYELSFDLVSGATQARMDETMQWIAAGKLHTRELITHRFPVEQAAQAWKLIASKLEPVLGVVLDWPVHTS